MELKSYAIRRIAQKTNHSFEIEWNDGIICEYKLGELQQKCPCAACVDELKNTVNEFVKAKRIVSVGRYALRIEFTTGCSMGIYSFDMLREMI